jgi:AcrR family transcriptional regulator
MAARTRTRVVSPARPGRARAGGASVAPSEQLAEIQRARLLAGAVRAIDELGYARATVTDITAKSRVSRRTFYELFSNYDDCVAAVLESGVRGVREQLATEHLDGLGWRERVRGGLWAILCFLDSEPALARVCVVQSARGGQRLLERREQVLDELAAIIDEGRLESAPGNDCPPLTAEGLVGAALSIVHTRLARGEPAPLTDLLGDLMAMIVLPYLGPGAARAERKRKTPAAGVSVGSERNGTSSRNGRSNGNGQSDDQNSKNGDSATSAARAGADPLAGIPMRLTYRTVRVLEAVAGEPGISNRKVGNEAGINDQGQMSKLLARLERYGLLENTGEGHAKGEANAWQLTEAGRNVVQVVAVGLDNAKRGTQ